MGERPFASGLLPELIAALRHSRPGDLVALAGEDESQPFDRFIATNLMSQMPRSHRGDVGLREAAQNQQTSDESAPHNSANVI